MPERDSQAGHSAKLLQGLLWGGVVLAPLAAAVVLIGGGSTSVRFAVLLLAVSVVLIGASMLIRADPVLLRMDVEDRVAEEVENLRRQMRAEFASAAAAPPAPEAARPPLPVRTPGGRAQVGAVPPEPDYAPQPSYDNSAYDAEPAPQVYGNPQGYEGYESYDGQGYDGQDYEQAAG